MLSPDLKEKVLRAQKNEATEHLVYQKLAATVQNKKHAEILEKISREELSHYEFFKNLTLEEVSPDKFKLFFYLSVSRLLGLNFGLKLMENGEDTAQDVYLELKEAVPGIENIALMEKEHEKALIDLIDEERLKYISSVVLGLNDALVELTASLAGFTLALQRTKLIGVVGLITGLAAAMSMAVAEYLSTKHETTDKDPLKASVYTGIAYVLTVVLLVLPYFLFENMFLCLGLALTAALGVIFLFTSYTSVAKNLPFRQRFLEMACLSLGIATITFFIGMAIRKIFGVDV